MFNSKMSLTAAAALFSTAAIPSGNELIVSARLGLSSGSPRSCRAVARAAGGTRCPGSDPAHACEGPAESGQKRDFDTSHLECMFDDMTASGLGATLPPATEEELLALVAEMEGDGMSGDMVSAEVSVSTAAGETAPAFDNVLSMMGFVSNRRGSRDDLFGKFIAESGRTFYHGALATDMKGLDRGQYNYLPDELLFERALTQIFDFLKNPEDRTIEQVTELLVKHLFVDHVHADKYGYATLAETPAPGFVEKVKASIAETLKALTAELLPSGDAKQITNTLYKKFDSKRFVTIYKEEREVLESTTLSRFARFATAKYTNMDGMIIYRFDVPDIYNVSSNTRCLYETMKFEDPGTKKRANPSWGEFVPTEEDDFCAACMQLEGTEGMGIEGASQIAAAAAVVSHRGSVHEMFDAENDIETFMALTEGAQQVNQQLIATKQKDAIFASVQRSDRRQIVVSDYLSSTDVFVTPYCILSASEKPNALSRINYCHDFAAKGYLVPGNAFQTIVRGVPILATPNPIARFLNNYLSPDLKAETIRLLTKFDSNGHPWMKYEATFMADVLSFILSVMELERQVDQPEVSVPSKTVKMQYAPASSHKKISGHSKFGPISMLEITQAGVDAAVDRETVHEVGFLDSASKEYKTAFGGESPLDRLEQWLDKLDVGEKVFETPLVAKWVFVKDPLANDVDDEVALELCKLINVAVDVVAFDSWNIPRSVKPVTVEPSKVVAAMSEPEAEGASCSTMECAA